MMPRGATEEPRPGSWALRSPGEKSAPKWGRPSLRSQAGDPRSPRGPEAASRFYDAPWKIGDGWLPAEGPSQQTQKV